MAESLPPGAPAMPLPAVDDPDFDVPAKVTAWVAIHGREELDSLYRDLPGGRSTRTIEIWYDRERVAERQVREEAERKREDKHLELQERTVAAAEDSARAAIASARWAKAALWISLLAVLIAALEHWK